MPPKHAIIAKTTNQNGNERNEHQSNQGFSFHAYSLPMPNIGYPKLTRLSIPGGVFDYFREADLQNPQQNLWFCRPKPQKTL
jgi:hypothetical protein